MVRYALNSDTSHEELKTINFEPNSYQPSSFFPSEFTDMLDGMGSSAWNFTANGILSEANNPQPTSHRSAEVPRSHQVKKSKTSTPCNALEKRRQQNRISQIAHRERKKKLVDDLYRQLEECTKHNQALHRTLETMKDMNESMALQIGHILNPQQPSPELLSSRIGSERYSQSIASWDGGQVETEEDLVMC